MMNVQAFATEIRQQVLDTIAFCEACNETLSHAPSYYRVPNDIQDMAAIHLHTVMGYRADQPEI